MEQEESLEKRLVKLVDEANMFLEEFESRIENDLQVILLIGITGAGKSTIFNFLAGAEFELNENDEDGDELRVIQNENQYSTMKSGMSSITRQPKYYFNDHYNHLLIDFPGFQDTRGELDKLMVQMLFFKIVTKIPIKVVFVLRHPENDLNDRGVGLQDFIKEQFREQNLDSTRFTLILNSYAERLKDEVLKQRLQKQLQQRFQNANENIFVVRKVKDNQSLQAIFSPENRQQLWENLIQSNAIQFIPKLLPSSASVSKYLKEKSHQIVVDYCLSINESLNQQIMNLNNEEIVELNQSINQLIIVLQSSSKGDITNWCIKYVETCELIATQLKSDSYIIQGSEDFIIIFEYFSQFQDFIDGFEECQKAGILASQQCKSMLTLINMKLIQLEEKSKSQEQINLQQQLLKNEQKNREEIETQFKLEFEKNKENIEVIKNLQSKYNEMISQNDEQIQKYKNQLIQLQDEQKKFMERRQKENEEKMNQLVSTINNLQQQFLKQEEQRKEEELQRRKEREMERLERQRKDEEIRRKDEEMRRKEEENRIRQEKREKEAFEERKREYLKLEEIFKQQAKREEDLKKEMAQQRQYYENQQKELYNQKIKDEKEAKLQQQKMQEIYEAQQAKNQKQLQEIQQQNISIQKQLEKKRGRGGCIIA